METALHHLRDRCTGKPRGSGFTLLEIVLVLLIIAILVTASVPAFKGIRDGEKARRPLVELVLMAQTARARAIKDGRPYQVIFEEGGFRATRHFDPYAEQYEVEDFFTELMQEEEARANGGGALANLADGELPPEPELSLRYELPQGTLYEVQRWGEAETLPLSNGRLHSWVFQPTGICNPLRVRFDAEGEGYHEAVFNALTADIDQERYYVP